MQVNVEKWCLINKKILKENSMMNKVLSKEEATNVKVANGVNVMSSLRIAEITGRRHSHVARDTKEVLEDIGVDASKFEYSYLDSMNRKQTHYLLPELEFVFVITKYSDSQRL